MKNQHAIYLVLGLVIASTLSLGDTVVENAKASEPICYLQTSDGKQVDLSGLCDRTASPQPSPIPQATGAEDPTTATGEPQAPLNPPSDIKVGEIDPKAPVDNPVVVRDQPSQLWYTLPNLPSPPVKGPTTDSP